MSLLRKYFVWPFFGFFILFYFLGFLYNDERTFWQHIIITLEVSMLNTVFIGGTSYVIFEWYYPYKKKKVLRNEPFRTLREMGFKETDQGYLVVISDRFVWRVTYDIIKVHTSYVEHISAEISNPEILKNITDKKIASTIKKVSKADDIQVAPKESITLRYFTTFRALKGQKLCHSLTEVTQYLETVSKNEYATAHH